MRLVDVALALRLVGAGLAATLPCALASADPSAGTAPQPPLLSQQSPGYQPPPAYQPPAPNNPPPPNYQQPPPGYQQAPPNYQQPPPGYQQPAPSYPPPPNYQQPPPGYQQAPPNYQQPPPGYQQPAPGYPPPPNYQAPPANYPQYPPPPNYPPPPGAAPSNGEAPIAAVWTSKELRFVFMGFTAKYSCDGLRERIRGVLLKLGARPDVQVSQGPCSGSLGQPTSFPSVSIKMSVLEPAESARPVNGGAPPQIVPAHWQRVDLTAAPDAVRQAGDCEVIEQIKQSILPQFTTRNVDYKSTCIPNQLTLGGTQLRTDVLVIDEPARNAAAH